MEHDDRPPVAPPPPPAPFASGGQVRAATPLVGAMARGQLGPRLQTRLDPDVLKVAIAAVFLMVGVFMLFTLIR